MLNVCYISMNTIDLLRKSNKIDISKEVRMRIISGSARGTILYTLEGEATRPTLDRVKESLFNMLQNRIKEAVVLDLFAGSGALGIEALSRGAKEATFVDQSSHAIDIIKKNTVKAHCEESSIVLKQSYENVLEQIKGTKQFDLIFVDPPYEAELAVKAVQKIIESDILAEEGIIIIETDQEQRELENLQKLKVNVYDLRKYGRVKLIFLNRKG